MPEWKESTPGCSILYLGDVLLVARDRGRRIFKEAAWEAYHEANLDDAGYVDTLDRAKQDALASARNYIDAHLRIFSKAKATLDAYEDAHPGPVSDGSGPSHPND